MISPDVLITGVIGIVSSFTSSWATYFFTRSKYNSEVDNIRIANMQKSLEFYQELSDDNKHRLDDALKRSAYLEEEVKELRRQVTELTMSICLDLTCNERVVNPQLKKFQKSKLNERPLSCSDGKCSKIVKSK